jgi:hypothetical protein
MAATASTFLRTGSHRAFGGFESDSQAATTTRQR